MSDARVLGPEELVPGPPTPGVERLTAFEGDDRWIGRSRAEPGVVSGWHHHGGHDTYFFVLSGAARIELGGGRTVEVHAGDFALLPAGTVHREGPMGDVALDAIVVRLGSGPQVFEAFEPSS